VAHTAQALRGRRLAAVVAIATVLVVSWQHRASAHASLLSSDPADGAALSAAPAAVTLKFDDDIELARSSAQLIDENGRLLADTAASAPLHLTIATGSGGNSTSDVLVIKLPSLQPGAYQVKWRALSALDLHATNGVVVFGVGRSAGPSAAVSNPWPKAINVAATSLQLLTVVLVIGLLALSWLLVPAMRAGPVAALTLRRLATLAAGAGLANVASGGLMLVVKAADLGRFDIAAVLRSRYGHGWIAGESAAIALAGLLLLERSRMRKLDVHSVRQRPPAATAAIGTVLIVATVLAQTMTSHLARAGGGSVTTTAAATLHLIAAAIWVGALLALAVLLPRLLRGPDRGFALELLRRFGWLAAPCIAVITVTGLILAGRQVVTVDALLYTIYGQLLVLKVIIVAAVAVLGARNAFLARRSTTPVHDGVRRWWVTLECVAMVAVIGLAGALANGKPARGPEYTPVSTSLPPPVHAQVNDLLLGLSVRPGRPGPDFVTVSVQNTRIPAPAPISSVVVRYTAPPPLGRTETHPAVRASDGNWTDATSVIDRPGSWTLHVVVARAGMRDVVLDTSWTVLAHPSSFTDHVRVSADVLEPTLDMISVGLTGASVVGGGALYVGIRRRKRRGNTRPTTSAQPESVKASR
jgi:copper transport protein